MARRNGMGDYSEEQYQYDQFRDSGAGQYGHPSDVVYDPRRHPDPNSLPRNERVGLIELERILERIYKPINVQPPPFQEPPWFSEPVFITNTVSVPGLGQRTLATIRIENRQQVIITCLGLESDPPNALSSFWFERSGGEIIPVFDDQSGFVPPDPGFNRRGFTTVMPAGSVDNPFSLRQCGHAIRVRGPEVVTWNVRGWGVGVDYRVLLGYYIYWLPNAGQFQDAQYMVDKKTRE